MPAARLPSSRSSVAYPRRWKSACECPLSANGACASSRGWRRWRQAGGTARCRLDGQESLDAIRRGGRRPLCRVDGVGWRGLRRCVSGVDGVEGDGGGLSRRVVGQDQGRGHTRVDGGWRLDLSQRSDRRGGIVLYGIEDGRTGGSLSWVRLQKNASLAQAEQGRMGDSSQYVWKRLETGGGRTDLGGGRLQTRLGSKRRAGGIKQWAAVSVGVGLKCGRRAVGTKLALGGGGEAWIQSSPMPERSRGSALSAEIAVRGARWSMLSAECFNAVLRAAVWA